MTEPEVIGWLSSSYDYEPPRRGQFRKGVILSIDEQGITVDIGLKREGFVPHKDVQRLGKGASSELEAGQEVTTRIVRPWDRDGNLILSLYQARLEQDWRRAQEMLECGEVWQGKVTGCNRGGLKVLFGRLDGFVPGSHLSSRDGRRLPPDERVEAFRELIGRELPLKVIEVQRDKRRLVLSERLARRYLRDRQMERLLDELLEGEVLQGTVSRLCDFGAFVDLGGADGLVHISELAWAHVRHPSEVVQVGDEVQVYVLRLDRKRKRIALSLKRLQPDPWDLVELTYTEGQLVSGVVTGIADFGVFVTLEVGVEGLVHVSELADPPPDPGTVVQRGDELVLRVLRIEPYRRRIGLSLMRVPAEERAEWLRSEGMDGSSNVGTASDDGGLPGGEMLPDNAVPLEMAEEVEAETLESA